jgi:cytochrome c-type biogenesis protein CcmF
MEFVGEHLRLGDLGHFFVLLSFTAALLSTISYYKASKATDGFEKKQWLTAGRLAFFTEGFCLLTIFGIMVYICANHYFEYMYAYKHASLELPFNYLLACIWEGQEGSFLLWAIWHFVIAAFFVRNSNTWEAPVMVVINTAQVFLTLMILGIYIGGIKIGSSPFSLTRNEIVAPIFNNPNYLALIKDGVGLNPLLRNYWMVIHPPVLFLGFASTIVPMAYAYASTVNKKYSEWVKPVMPHVLFSVCVLGVGIMMGGKWAYESLNFGGYWAWDPVENAVLVPWLILVAGLHTLVVYNATGYSLRASYLFVMLTFIFIVYSTFLTRTGILGDTSVHAFTDAGEAISFSLFGKAFSFNAMNTLIFSFLAFFTIAGFYFFTKHYKKIPTIVKEEAGDSKEFWMYIGSLVFFITSIFIIAKTSVPIVNKIFGSNIAPPEDVEFGYNKVTIFVAIIIGLLTAIAQYLKYKNTSRQYLIKKIGVASLIAIGLATLLFVFYPINYTKQGYGFLGSIYVALFATLFSVVTNMGYIFTVIKGKFLKAGSPITHAGFMLMLFGMLLSSANKKIISSSSINGITLPTSGKDPMTKQQDDPRENLSLLRKVPTSLLDYKVTFVNDSLSKEKGRKFYNLDFVRNESNERFTLRPDIYLMKDNNMTSNPDIKSYLTKDIFTYVSYAPNKEAVDDTVAFKESIVGIGDTSFYSNGFMVLQDVETKKEGENVLLKAIVRITSKDDKHFNASPSIVVDSIGIINVDDTVYAQNMFLRFSGVADGRKIKLGVKESDKLIDFVTVKAYVFPYINLVWIGLTIMAVGLLIAMLQRKNASLKTTAIVLIASTLFVFYMFLLANN